MDAKRPTPRHIIIKMLKVKDKERILKAAREKQRVNSKKRLSADFSKKPFSGKKGIARSIQSDENKDLQPRLLYPAKLSFKMEGKIKCFPYKVKLKEFIITKPLLYKVLKGLIQVKEEDQNYEQ